MKHSRIEFSPNRWTESQRKEVIRIVRRWRSRLLVEHWTLQIVPMPRANARDPKSTLAQVDVSERYATATVRIYPPFWKESPAERERVLMHELTHAPLNRIANLLDRAIRAGVATEAEVDDAHEQLVEHFTNVVWDAYT